MRTIQVAIVSFQKPFFTYNEKGCKHLPTSVDAGSEAISTLENGDQYFEGDTIEEVMAEFDRLGFVMPEDDQWDFPERKIKVSIPDSNLLDMLKAYPELIGFLDILKEFIIKRNGNQLIYLEEIYPEHKELFNAFGANITIG